MLLTRKVIERTVKTAIETTIRDMAKVYSDMIVALKSELADERKRNKALMDRVMARNYEEFAVGRLENYMRGQNDYEREPSKTNEHLVGMAVTGEEISGED